MLACRSASGISGPINSKTDEPHYERNHNRKPPALTRGPRHRAGYINKDNYFSRNASCELLCSECDTRWEKARRWSSSALGSGSCQSLQPVTEIKSLHPSPSVNFTPDSRLARAFTSLSTVCAPPGSALQNYTLHL